MKKFFEIFLTTAIFALLLTGCQKKEPDIRGEVYITSSPDGAKVLLNNKEIGLTPLKIKLRPDTYIFEISKVNYKPFLYKLESAARENRNLEIPLTPVTSSVMIISKPAGAEVEIDGKSIGETPKIIHEQSIGNHKAIIKKPGFTQQEVSWDVEDARPQLVKTSLSSNMGTLNIDSSPTNMDLLIDDKPCGKTPFKEQIEQGEHKIKIEKTGFAPYEQIVVITRGQEKKVYAQINILPGSLSILSTPPGAAVFLNDQQYKNTPCEINNLAPDKYTLKLEKGGYDPVTKEITIAPGQHCEVSITMDSNLGGIDILVNPPGVTIFLDGKKMGVTEEGQRPNISKIFEIRGLSSGQHTVTASHSRALPPEKSLTVVVSKGQVSRPKQITMWIADTYLKLKNGKEMNGRIRQENDQEIIFEPEPSIGMKYSRDEIAILKKLQDK